MSFKEINVKDLCSNPFKLIGDDWMLITAGNEKKFNTMTASWGGVGVLWNKNVTFAFVRPQRYTFEFLEKEDYYTLTFYNKEYKQSLVTCGQKSGRDYDKIKEAGLTVDFSEKAPFFKEANIILVCHKLHEQFIDPNCFVDTIIEDSYPNKDYHKVFIGDIVKALVKD